MTHQKLHQGTLDRITRKWWFFVSFLLLQFVVPPYASKGYNFPEEWGDVIMQALRYAIVYSFPAWYPLFKIIPIALILLVISAPKKTGRIFSIYVAFSYAFFAFGQNISLTEKYGVAICTINLIMFPIVAVFWGWEAWRGLNDFTFRKPAIWKYWVVPLALLAFWYPLNSQTYKPDFNPVYFFTNVAGVTFCMMTPVYVGLLTLYYPKVNIATLRVTSLVGLIIGLYNMNVNFIVRPSILWWNGVLHIPLLVISLYGLIISLRSRPIEAQTNQEDDMTEAKIASPG